MSDTSSLLTNSVWPNGLKEDDEGYAVFYPLGTNKVDVSAITWPTGSKVISPFVYDANDKLVGLIDTKAIINQNKTVLDLPSNYTTFKVELSDEFIALRKSSNCTNFDVRYIHDKNYSGSITSADIDSDLKSYIQGATKVIDNILYDVNNNIIGAFNTNSIINGECSPEGENKIFSSDITVFESDLSNLTNGKLMFYQSKLASFASDLSNLTDGGFMFSYCSSLTSFSGDLSSLTDGDDMFSYSALTSFSGDLSSLTTSYNMFYYCKLDAPSVKNIIDTINTSLTGFTLGMGCNNTTEDKNLFAQEVGYSDMTSLLAALSNKGWTVTAQYNGRPTTTYSLRRPSEDTLPVFVKLEEVEETEKYADYTSEDGSKKYRLEWFHETTGSTEGYTQFNSFEEAIEILNIKPIERN